MQSFCRIEIVRRIIGQLPVKCGIYFERESPNFIEEYRTTFAKKMISAPAAESNKTPLLVVLKEYIPTQTDETSENGLFALEIASGTGQHIVFFAEHFPHVTWQPSEYVLSSLNSITAYTKHTGVKNVLPPFILDVTTPPEQWGEGKLSSGSCNIILNINMVHISPFACTEGLFAGAGFLLKPNGMLITYGPYAHNGRLSPQSNVYFDQMLKSQNLDWGIRDIAELRKLAKKQNIVLDNIEDMPANNKTLIWRKIS